MRFVLATFGVLVAATAQAQVPGDVVLHNQARGAGLDGITVDGTVWVDGPFTTAGPGGYFDGNFTADGDLYVVSGFTNTIVEFDGVTGAEISQITPATTPGSVDAWGQDALLVVTHDGMPFQAALSVMDLATQTFTPLTTLASVPACVTGCQVRDISVNGGDVAASVTIAGIVGPEEYAVFIYKSDRDRWFKRDVGGTGIGGVRLMDDGSVVVGSERVYPGDMAATDGVVRVNAAGIVWERSLNTTTDDAMDDMIPMDDGTLWVFDQDGGLYRVDPDTGVNVDGAFPAAFDASFPSAGVHVKGTYDECPSNDGKYFEGVCGCDYYDVDAFPSPGTACVHVTATVGSSVTLGDGAYVQANADVGNSVGVGAGATVGVNAVVGNSATIGANTVLSRGSEVGASADIGSDVLVGRSAQVLAGATVGPNSSLGYSSLVSANSELGASSVVGNGVQFLTDGIRVGVDGAGTGVVLGRDVTLTGPLMVERGVVVGPSVQLIGPRLGSGTRVRKNVQMLGTCDVGERVRIGRDVVFEGGNVIGNDVNLRTDVRVVENGCLPDNTDVARGDVVGDVSCP